MGLHFSDVEGWLRWRSRQRPLHQRLLSRSGRAQDDPGLHIELWVRGHEPTLLVACDAQRHEHQSLLLTPLALLPDLPAIVAKPANLDLQLPPGDWKRRPSVDLSVQRVLSLGAHMEVGRWAQRLAKIHSWDQVVIQHGLLTPFSPPPPFGATVFTWSEHDASFLSEGRPDVTPQVTGSSLLWEALAHPAPEASRFERPVLLGELPESALPHRALIRSTEFFWRDTNCLYDPHPDETTKQFRRLHSRWLRRGMKFTHENTLLDINRPVVGATSTRLLIAQARGLPVWGFHQEPPSWLREVWDRYGIARWREAPGLPTFLQNDPIPEIVRYLAGGTLV